MPDLREATSVLGALASLPSCCIVTYHIELGLDVARAMIGRRLDAAGDGTSLSLHLARGRSERKVEDE